MNLVNPKRLDGRQRRHIRVRKKIEGTAERPRLCVFRSARHIYAQIVDDVAGTTILSASTQSKTLRDGLDGDKTAKASAVGKAIGEACKQRNIESVVFDRGGYRFHGRVKAVADGAREAGLRF